jgi:hypothetical protein
MLNSTRSSMRRVAPTPPSQPGSHPAQAITTFATASANLYTEIARDDPQPWNQHLAAAAASWLAYCNASGTFGRALIREGLITSER